MDAKDAEVAFYVAEADKATKPSLRDDLIEAGARAWMEFEGDDWDAMGPKPQQAITEATEHIFDAVLDVLADRADEWWVEAAEGRAVDCRTEHWVVEPEGLVAVLREGDEQ